ncbi:MAG: hypothetical protein ACK4EX_02835 [Thermaurantimonas sp.]|uniref:hypothetical protein n=1 Tax=Thermaurantimonas sp. TaxID=2681568 RepID=UPI00391D74C1
MKSILKTLLTSLSVLAVLNINAQDARLEKILNNQKLPYQYDQENVRYIVGYPLKKGRAQIVKITAYHTIGSISTMTISTMVRSTTLKGTELENWVTSVNKRIKNGKFKLNREVVFFEVEIPVNSSDKSILEALELVAVEGDKAEVELTEGDNF